MVKAQNPVDLIAATHLGKVGGEGYSTTYDPSLLVAIPRYHNRLEYGINDLELPFVGYDVWNCYEVSALCSNGYPVTGILKIVYPSNSSVHVESKSLKLYLNSFNMTKFGPTVKNTIRKIETTIEDDLSKLLDTKVQVTFHTKSVVNPYPFDREYDYYVNIDNLVSYENIVFDQFKSDANMLVAEPVDEDDYLYNGIWVKSSNLRSNCRVTGQPDWGTIYIHIEGKKLPSYETLMKYIVSHRSVNHFHEEICEMTFAHLTEAYNPTALMVACLYTRRGGIDINPIRASHLSLIPEGFVDPAIINAKELMQ